MLKNKIDILVNNAGLALGLDPFYKTYLDDWEEMIDTNIKGLLYVSRAILPQMRELKTAHIINLGSVKFSTITPGAVETNFLNVRFKNYESKAQNVYENYKALCAKGIYAVIISVLNTSAHVNIQYLDIMPISQRNVFVLYKEKEFK